MRKNVLLPFMVALTALVLLGCPNQVTPPTDIVINIVAIPGVTAPVFGAIPVTAITETAQYTGTITWNGTPSTFAASTVYTATITLTAKTGFTLNGIAANSFTIIGASATNAVDSGVVTAVFLATGAAPDTVINIAAIPGVTAPVTGATPVTTITETDQYTGTVTWIGTPTTFAASTEYTATITLTPKPGYTLAGVTAAFFTVVGATNTYNSGYSGVVTAHFPATLATVINLSAIPGVTAPVEGARPVYFTETDQYLVSLQWSPNMLSGTFEGGTEYTATITLTKKAGYTFAGVGANFFTVTGATSVTNLANSGLVTAVFPGVINLSAIPGVTAPVEGAIPVTTITETAQYTGLVSWSPADATFAPSTVYTATITLTPKTGYTLAGVTVNFFTVAGSKSDTNTANSGVVTVEFPAAYGEDYTSANIGTLKFVPAGQFQRDDTYFNISVITQPYRMSEHEITREQFLAIMGTDPSNTTYSSGTTDPVQKVNWYHAIAFCNKLSLADGLTPVYSVTVGGTPIDWSALTYASIPITSNADWNVAVCNWTATGYRLPTEMEWMWAAMGAPADGQGADTNTTGYNKAFAGSTGSNVIGDYAWYSDNSKGTTHPVGIKLPNELGLYDMSGNVLEWTWDRYDTNVYPTGTQTDYLGITWGSYRVQRGGCMGSGDFNCSVAKRFHDNPYYQSYVVGFRVVRH